MTESMTKQDVFEFLSSNLTIRVGVEEGMTYGPYGNREITVKLFLTNPISGKKEQISEDQCVVSNVFNY